MSEIIRLCPRCGAEYREGFSICSDCHVPLVSRLDTEAGDPLVPLAMETSFDLVAELLDRFEKKAIPYVIEAGTALRCLDDETAALYEPEDWQARIYVVSSRQKDAAGILADVKFRRQLERLPGASRRQEEDQ